MNDLGLDLASLTSPGRKPRAVEGEIIRHATGEDIASLALPSIPNPDVKRMTERHHALARSLALGVTEGEAAVSLGYDPSRVSILRSSPAFAELVAFYRGQLGIEFAEFGSIVKGLASDAMLILRDRLEEQPEEATLGQLLEIAKFGADRSGFGPQSKQEVTVKTDLGSRLAAARERLQRQQQERLLSVPDAEIIEGGK